MKMFLPASWIQFCSLSWCINMCLGTTPVRIIGTEKKEVTVFFNNYGTLMNFSSVPKCESGGKINLLEYSYGQMECPSVSADDCTSVRDDELLPEEELLLHEECSLRNVCTTLRFPTRLATLENKLNAMTIKFQCIDSTHTYLDICEKRNLTFSNILHLTLGDRTHFTDCRCWVNLGKFTMLLNDIRLTQNNGSKCSPAELIISSHRLSCNGTKQIGYGSVFNEKSKDITSERIYLSLVSKSEDISPDMVWLIFYPQETCHIECEGDKSSQKHAPDTTTPKSKLVQNTLTSSSTVTSSTQTNTEQPDKCVRDNSTAVKADNNVNTVLLVIMLVILLVIVVIAIVGFAIGCRLYLVWKRRKNSRKKSKQNRPPKATEETETFLPSSNDNPGGQGQNRSAVALQKYQQESHRGDETPLPVAAIINDTGGHNAQSKEHPIGLVADCNEEENNDVVDLEKKHTGQRFFQRKQ